MNKPSLLPVLRQVGLPMTCTGAGLFIGQVVMGLSAHHQGSLTGLAFALVFLVSSSAAVTLTLMHLNGRLRPRHPRASVEHWLLLLAAGVMASIWLAGGLPSGLTGR